MVLCLKKVMNPIFSIFFYFLKTILMMLLLFHRSGAQEFSYGIYQQKHLMGYLKTQLSPSQYQGQDAFELRRLHYLRVEGDQEERLQVFLNRQGELLEASQQIRSKNLNQTLKVLVSGNVLKFFLIQEALQKSWEVPFQGKIYFSFQTFLWCNPAQIKSNNSFSLQTLQMNNSLILPKMVVVQVELKDWGNLQDGVGLRFKSWQKNQENQWSEGFLNSQGHLLKFTIYVESKEPFLTFEPISTSLIEEFGPYGIRLPLNSSVYSQVEELEFVGPPVTCIPSPYLEIESLSATQQKYCLKSVLLPYRDEWNPTSPSFNVALFERCLEQARKTELNSTGSLEMVGKCRLFVRLLQKAGIGARPCYGFRLEKNEWIFCAWLEIDRGQGWEPFDWERQRFGIDAKHFYPGIPLNRWSEFLGKQFELVRVVKAGQEIRAEHFIETGEYFFHRLWGLKFKKPIEVDYVPSTTDQILLSDVRGACLLITARPLGPECLAFEWFDFYVQNLLQSYEQKKIQSRSVDQIAPQRKIAKLTFRVEAEEPLKIRVWITSRGPNEGLLFVLIAKEKYEEETKKWFQPWLTSVWFE